MNSPRALNSPAEARPAFRLKWAPDAGLKEALGGDEESIAELVDAFTTDTAARLQRMRAALLAGDGTRLRNEAHPIKGSSRQVGAGALGDVCQQVELAPAPTTLPEFSSLVELAQERFSEIAAAMADYCACRR